MFPDVNKTDPNDIAERKSLESQGSKSINTGQQTFPPELFTNHPQLECEKPVETIRNEGEHYSYEYYYEYLDEPADQKLSYKDQQNQISRTEEKYGINNLFQHRAKVKVNSSVQDKSMHSIEEELQSSIQEKSHPGIHDKPQLIIQDKLQPSIQDEPKISIKDEPKQNIQRERRQSVQSTWSAVARVNKFTDPYGFAHLDSSDSINEKDSKI